MDAYLRLSDTHIGYSVLTHNCDDENIANETQDEDDSEGDGDEKECEPPDHDLTLLIHPDLGSRSQYFAQNSRLSLCQLRSGLLIFTKTHPDLGGVLHLHHVELHHQDLVSRHPCHLCDAENFESIRLM